MLEGQVESLENISEYVVEWDSEKPFCEGVLSAIFEGCLHSKKIAAQISAKNINAGQKFEGPMKCLAEAFTCNHLIIFQM